MHLLNDLPVPAIKLSPETKIILSNKGAHTLFEWNNLPAKEPLFTDFLSDEDKEDFLDFFKTNNIGAVVSLHDITDLNQAKEQLQFMAYHDPLTTLPNRRLYHDLLLQNLKQADRNIQKVGVLFLDMDNFKPINDLYGHNTGDELLKEVASTLQTCLRESDLICRWGGDEFVIALLENYRSEDIVKVAEKICKTVHQCIKQENSLFNVSVSIGIAISPETGKILIV